MDHSFVVVDVFVVGPEAGAVDRKFVAVGRGVAGGRDFAAYISSSSITQGLGNTAVDIVAV